MYEVYEPCGPNTMLPPMLKFRTNFFVGEIQEDGESTLYRGELVGHHDVEGRRGSLNEYRVLLYCRSQL
ncbi:hypothetical protein CRG98_046360 [Punica granatum]|uniref:Uncharacterized protein n=1 Tax=Punica granatum TaxID=22663 RepID=A0A2I0HNE4_PUNGR|nr:hypothetical protein CRG98_046360 [Punica granatum]